MRGPRGHATPLLCLATFLSGCAALVFETLWFQQAGLVLGNALWSSSLVLASFMAGLAVGNLVGGRLGPRLRRPLAAYAGLELVVGATGAALVAGLPLLTLLLLPALQAALPVPGLLHAVRAAVAFVLLVVPASAMGFTLPVLVEGLRRDERRFAWKVGQLYGWNTLGAVAGALVCELALIPWLGLRGAGLAAAGLNALAAALAWRLSRVPAESEDEAGGSVAARLPAGEAPPPRLPAGPLAAAFLAGALLLALEVVWFRLLLLTAVGTSLSFATMLAVVLAGIAGGGLLAAGIARPSLDAARAASVVGLLAGVATALSYAVFPVALAGFGTRAVGTVFSVAALAVPLMLPTCLLSGLLFPLLGEAVRRGRASDAGALGLLTLSNTLGAMLGALAGGFLLVPRLGVEGSLFLLSGGYAFVGLLVLPAARRSVRAPRALLPAAAAAVLLAAALAAFPFGLMGRRLLPTSLSRWVDLRTPGLEVLAAREGLTETAVLLRQSRWGTPVSYRLITNAISMSGLDSFGGRYMKAFVYLPVALNPRAKHALLISYGVGSTARALADTASLETIDVAEVSRDVIEATRGVYPEPGTHPLDDPRVRLHVEDGRFFLLATERRFDIITAEPPPPNNAGMASLYSREYFALVRSRLAQGGIVSHWLPAYQMPERDSQAITAAFCAVFDDCTLWSGSGAEWVLLGTREAAPVDEAGFSAQWRDPRTRASLAGFGFEGPEDLGATFLAGNEDLRRWTQGVPPLVDDYPQRVSPRTVEAAVELYLRLAELPRARERFARSGFVRRLWPEPLRRRTLEAFEQQGPVLQAAWVRYGAQPSGLGELHALLSRSGLRTAVLWLMGSDVFEERAARAAAERGTDDPEIDEVLGIAAMADRDYAGAERRFARAQPHSRAAGRLLAWRVLALCLAGEADAAAALAAAGAGACEGEPGWAQMREACGLGAPRPDEAASLRRAAEGG
jgi:predicted membrane-bound spermidine synthase